MSNEEYLQQYIKYVGQTHDNLEIVILDLNLTIQHMSNRSLQILRLPKVPVGKRVRDLPIPQAAHAPQVLPVSTAIMEKQTSAKYIFAYIDNGQVYMSEHFSSAIINHFNGETAGIFIEVRMFETCETMTTYFNILQSKLHRSYPTPDSSLQNQIQLTTREHEVLFLVVMGKSHKEIAEILSATHGKPIQANSIASIISKQIYPKFDVYNMPSLIEKAITMNLVNTLPHTLLKTSGVIAVEFEESDTHERYVELKKTVSKPNTAKRS